MHSVHTAALLETDRARSGSTPLLRSLTSFTFEIAKTSRRPAFAGPHGDGQVGKNSMIGQFFYRLRACIITLAKDAIVGLFAVLCSLRNAHCRVNLCSDQCHSIDTSRSGSRTGQTATTAHVSAIEMSCTYPGRLMATAPIARLNEPLVKFAPDQLSLARLLQIYVHWVQPGL